MANYVCMYVCNKVLKKKILKVLTEISVLSIFALLWSFSLKAMWNEYYILQEKLQKNLMTYFLHQQILPAATVAQKFLKL